MRKKKTIRENAGRHKRRTGGSPRIKRKVGHGHVGTSAKMERRGWSGAAIYGPRDLGPALAPTQLDRHIRLPRRVVSRRKPRVIGVDHTPASTR